MTIKTLDAQIHSLRALELRCGKRREIDEQIRQLQEQRRKLRAEREPEDEPETEETETPECSE